MAEGTKGVRMKQARKKMLLALTLLAFTSLPVLSSQRITLMVGGID